MGRVKIGMIGCGWFGNFHLDNLLKNGDVDVVALVSSNDEKLKKTGEKVKNAHLYSNHRELYAGEKELDAVIISVPPDRHDDAEILAARKGVHIYVEKPIELSLKRALEIEEAINKAGIISSVGYQGRYSEVLERIKENISEHEVGLINGKWLGGIPGSQWWRKKERSGGQIVEQCTHIFDMLRYLFGEAHTVYSSGVKGIVKDVQEYNLEDASSTTISFDCGVVATIFTACYLGTIEGFKRVGLQIICRDSVIEYDWDREVRYIKNNNIETVPLEGGYHEVAINTFVEAVRTKNPEFIKSSYSDAVKTLELTLAANKSIMSGIPVKIGHSAK